MPTFSQAVYQQDVLVDDPPKVTVENLGPSLADLNSNVAQALSLCQVRGFLDSTKYRILSSEFRGESRGNAKVDVDNRYQATVYDYTHGKTLLINGIPFDHSAVSTTEANVQPIPDAEELALAAKIVGHPNGPVHGGMPPVLTNDFPNGTSHRILNIAINTPTSSKVFYVNMNNNSVHSPTPEIPHVPFTGSTACVAPLPASGRVSGKGLPGAKKFVITQGLTQLWSFEVTRPSSSSGTKGSGVELRNVMYKGKLLLNRAHVPILNVEYEKLSTGCGPHYRDWQYDEWPFRCSGTDLGPGFRLCHTPATTILDPPFKDGGDFTGVAYYIDGRDVVLKSQMSAGWYRYVSEWRFGVDGTLKPRFGFGAIAQDPYCVCQVHHHHVYWRFDFDIVTAGNNIVREYNDPPLFPPSNLHDKIYEIKRPKDPSRKRRWEISNTRTRHTYALIPGPNDGTRTEFGVGDLWVLQYHGNEFDDGVPFSLIWGTADQTKAHLDKFVTGESVKDKDVVVWYGAHFRHDHAHQTSVVPHIVGPDLRPVRWE